MAVMSAMLCTSCLKDTYEPDEDLNEYMQYLDTLYKREQESISKYLKDNNYNVEPTKSGLYKIVMREGTGDITASGRNVKLHYIGKLLDGREFDNSYERNIPLSTTIGAGMLISGFDEGVASMRKGEKCRLIIPSSLGYGISGTSGIPPFSTLVFDVELLEIK